MTTRSYTYLSRRITELYCIDDLSQCEITTLHYDGSTESLPMLLTKTQLERALAGDRDTRWAIEAAATVKRLIQLRRI